MDGRRKVLEDCCTLTNRIVRVDPRTASIAAVTDVITTTS